MKGAVRVEVAAEWVGMESDENDISKLRGNQLEACVRMGPGQRFTQDKEAVLKHNLGTTNSLSIHEVERGGFQSGR